MYAMAVVFVSQTVTHPVVTTWYIWTDICYIELVFLL